MRTDAGGAGPPPNNPKKLATWAEFRRGHVFASLAATDRAVLRALYIDFGDEQGRSFPSEPRLAAECGLSRPTVVRAKARLAACGLLRWKPIGRRTQYAVTLESGIVCKAPQRDAPHRDAHHAEPGGASGRCADAHHGDSWRLTHHINPPPNPPTAAVAADEFPIGEEDVFFALRGCGVSAAAAWKAVKAGVARGGLHQALEMAELALRNGRSAAEAAEAVATGRFSPALPGRRQLLHLVGWRFRELGSGRRRARRLARELVAAVGPREALRQRDAMTALPARRTKPTPARMENKRTNRIARRAARRVLREGGSDHAAQNAAFRAARDYVADSRTATHVSRVALEAAKLSAAGRPGPLVTANVGQVVG